MGIERSRLSPTCPLKHISSHEQFCLSYRISSYTYPIKHASSPLSTQHENPQTSHSHPPPAPGPAQRASPPISRPGRQPGPHPPALRSPGLPLPKGPRPPHLLPHL